jgi:hypothetical protein
MIPCRQCKQHQTKPWPPSCETERDWSTSRSFGHTTKCQSRRVQLLGILHSTDRTRDLRDRTPACPSMWDLASRAVGACSPCVGQSVLLLDRTQRASKSRAAACWSTWIDDSSTTCVNMARQIALCQHGSPPSLKDCTHRSTTITTRLLIV